ncbi:MAG: LicD family protein [Rikenellaceae bacterium]
MRKLTLDQIKDIQLSILKTVDAFCRANGIKYTLAGGTLIGAVRHKGYIPWDDDIDIYMLRKDYERFVNEFTTQNHKVYTYQNCDYYNMSFAKVSDERTVMNEYLLDMKSIGINIDVFPVDNIPDNEFRAKFFMKCAWLYRKASDYKRFLVLKDKGAIKNVILRIYKILVYPISLKLLSRRINQIATKYAGQSTKYVGNVIHGYGSKERCLNIGWDKHIEMEFEGEKFLVISSYDTYLKNVFGDYMTPPPIEKQVSCHDYEAFVK